MLVLSVIAYQLSHFKLTDMYFVSSVRKTLPVDLVDTVRLYDLSELYNRFSKSEARHQWRGGNQAFVAEW